MSNSKKDDDLSKNPFVALFPNVEYAKQYVEATRAGLAESKKLEQEIILNNEDKPKDVIKKETISTKSIKKSVLNSKDIIINDYLQRVFLITANCDENNSGSIMFGGVPHRCIKVEELETELVQASLPLQLNLENINQALLERLQLSEPVTKLCIQGSYREKALNAVMDAREELSIKYLADCYMRLNKENYLLQGKISKEKGFVDEISHVTEKCQNLITSYTGSILLQPEIFPTNNPNLQFLNILMKSIGEPVLQEFADKLIQSHTDPEDQKSIFSPILDQLWERSEKLSLLDPDVLSLLEVLLFFSKHTNLSWLLIKSNYWFPKDPSNPILLGAAFEKHTILGRFLRLSSLPDDFFNSVPNFFLEPSRQSESEMHGITDNIRRQIDVIVAKLHEFLYNLVQKPDMQHEVLYWLGICLHTNSQRAQMYLDYNRVAKCGFFLNLTHILLKFCEPFLIPQSKLLLKVDCRYGAIVATPDSILKRETPIHLIGLNKAVTMVEKPDNMPPVVGGNAKFKFIPEMFYITQQCYKSGFIKVFENYQELMKRLQKLSGVYQDARAQGTGDQMIVNIKNDFENGIRRQLAVKAHLINPSLTDLALKFSVASSYWLVQQTLAGKDFTEAKHRELKPKALPTEVAPALTVIPEFFPENIGDTVRMLGYFSEDTLERCEQLQHIMEFFAVFLGDINRIKNPHLRAKLAECLAAFLPKEKSLESNLFSFSFRKKSFEKSTVVPKILPKSLLQLFVDIEFTGHAMEFDQKFAYRHFMYAILEYIWKMPSYYATFKKLYEEGKVAYKRDLVFTTFPRFINLLMNDSTFLLDEALQNLVMIKTSEREKMNNEWDNLEVDERKRKEDNLVQFGHMARGYNTMANETVHVLCYITTDIQRPFASPCMADGMAAFLNYFFVHLVGPKSKDLKVKDFEKYNFDPGNLVKNITKIYISLGKDDQFCRAIVRDKRSYSKELFNYAIAVLQKLDGGANLSADLSKVAKRLSKYHDELLDGEKNTPEPPEEFVDPISCMLMYQPVKLPSSGAILCKSTIAKHLLSDEKDPFNRSPLRLDQVIPCTELEARIREWMELYNVEAPVYTAEDCGG